MPEQILRLRTTVRAGAGEEFEVSVVGEERKDGTWSGWLEFRPMMEGCATRRTSQETSQPNRDALAYWASGLEAVYLEGALSRAR